MNTYAATRGQRSNAAECLNDLVVASQRVSHALREAPPTGVLERDPSRKINAAARVTLLDQAVATDHLAAFAGLLTLPGSHGPSLATLDRSFLETWARAWWILEALTSPQAEYRARAMVVAELRAGAKRGIGLLSTEPIGVAIQRAEYERDSIKLMAPPTVPRPTDLVKKLLGECGQTPPDAIYSHLSGIAHGESIFTESLREEPWTDSFSPVAIPADNLYKYCTTLTGVTMIATAKLIQAWGLPTQISEEFLNATMDMTRRLRSALW